MAIHTGMAGTLDGQSQSHYPGDLVSRRSKSESEFNCWMAHKLMPTDMHNQTPTQSLTHGLGRSPCLVACKSTVIIWVNVVVECGGVQNGTPKSDEHVNFRNCSRRNDEYTHTTKHLFLHSNYYLLVNLSKTCRNGFSCVVIEWEWK